jgi:hypothetical protein
MENEPKSGKLAVRKQKDVILPEIGPEPVGIRYSKNKIYYITMLYP